MTLHIDIQSRVGSMPLDIKLDLEQGPAVLVGPNGAGKTSLLRILVGALTPGEGQIQLAGRTLFDSSRAVALPPEERRVGYVPQGQGLFPHSSALDNVAFGLRFGVGRLPRQQARQKSRALLSRLQAGSLAARQPQQLSGGERQRIALARALVVEPELLLLDEPLSALDAGARRQVRGLLARELSQRLSLVVSHDLRDAAALGARVYVMDKGRIVQQGSIAELRAAPVSDFVAELTSSPFDPARELSFPSED